MVEFYKTPLAVVYDRHMAMSEAGRHVNGKASLTVEGFFYGGTLGVLALALSMQSSPLACIEALVNMAVSQNEREAFA